MLDLSAKLNRGHPPVERITTVNLFEAYRGMLPYIVPVLTKDRRTFAGGRVVLKERLDALVSGDEERIEAWGDNHFDLADACIIYGDEMKFQLDSPLLTGIKGVVNIHLDRYIAIDIESVNAATNGNMECFEVSDSAIVTYGFGKYQQRETVQNVVLLKIGTCTTPSYIELSEEQFKAVNAAPINTKDMIFGRIPGPSMDEIVKNGEVIHLPWAIFPSEIVVPLVKKTFEYSRERYGYDTVMGVFFPRKPEANCAEMRALHVERLYTRSTLSAFIESEVGCIIGVAEKGVEGAP